MNLKNLGTGFGLSYLMRRAAGESKRDAFRRAGVGSLSEQAVREFDVNADVVDFTQQAIERLAEERKLERSLDRPIEFSFMDDPDVQPSADDRNEAAQDIQKAMVPDVEVGIALEEAIGELEEFIDALYQAKKVLLRYKHGVEEMIS